jgi:hypothetical protein
MTTQDERHAARTTIVGGQPPGNARELPPVPVGIEQALRLAAASSDFADALLQDRDRAVAAAELELTASEQASLRAVDGATLQQMIARVEQTLPDPERRAFLERASTAVALLVGGAGAAGGAAGLVGMAGCDEGEPGKQPPIRDPRSAPPPEGARPRPPRDRSVDLPEGSPPDGRPQIAKPAGIRPDRPTPETPPDAAAPRALAPGQNRPRPSKPKPDHLTKGIRPDRPPPGPPPAGVRPGRSRKRPAMSPDTARAAPAPEGTEPRPAPKDRLNGIGGIRPRDPKRSTARDAPRRTRPSQLRTGTGVRPDRDDEQE